MDSFAGQLPRPNGRPIRWPESERVTHAAETERAKEFGLNAVDILVLKALSHGLSHAETSEITGINIHTVKGSIIKTRRELKAKTTPHAIANAIRLKLIS